MYTAKIYVNFKESVVDPQAQQTQIALEKLSSSSIENFKIGKVFEFSFEAENEKQARELVDLYAKELLVNQVMENYSVELKEEN